MAQNKFPKRRSYNALEQALYVCSRYESFQHKVVGINNVIIFGELQPITFSTPYRVEVHYKFGKYPAVKIISPAIDENAPHMFSDHNICTFYPESLNWSREMKIADTIIPWISDWVFHYESWLVTGVWKGESDPRHLRRSASRA